METPAYLLALRARYPLHPVFNHVKPTETVLIEHPHVAETDPNRLAYTRNPKDGEDFLINGHKRQTLTSVTKYLRRHYPEMKDHELFALSQQSDEFKLLTDIKEIIHAVETGPSSCMKSSSSVCSHEWKCTRQHSVMQAWLKDPTNEEPDWYLHPYSVYDHPGWSLAIHKGPSPVDGTFQIVGRALVYKGVFVRSFYQNKDPAGYSQADTALEAWLQEKGCEKQDSWDGGTPIRHIATDEGPLLPYIDGDSCYVEVINDDILRIRKYACCGYYKADNTDGTGDAVEVEVEEEPVAHCTDCGDGIYDGDNSSYIRNDYGTCICSSCLDNYTYARAFVNGRNTRWYVPDDEAVYVDDEAWDEQNLSDDIVELENGDYAYKHNAVEIDGEWYLEDDECVVEIEGLYYLKRDCWKDVDGTYHTPDEEYVVVGDNRYTEDDERVADTFERGYCLVEDCWQDADGGIHHNSVDYCQQDGKLYTAAQFAELHKDQLTLEFV